MKELSVRCVTAPSQHGLQGPPRSGLNLYSLVAPTSAPVVADNIQGT